MSPDTVGVLREAAGAERRVALDPSAVERLTKAGRPVVLESGAGQAAWFPDEAYERAGAKVGSSDTVLADARILLSVGPPAAATADRLTSQQAVLGLLSPSANPQLIGRLNARGVTVVSLDGLPRTLSRAQGMDALSSQANVAGYRAVLVAAAQFPRFFPLLITAAGTSKPATVLVLGAGVAGLQAIGTARRLGAVVTGYDVRPAAREEVQSLGARFLQLATAITASGEGGYARELTDAERDAQQAELADHISRHDVVITTAQVPGRTPPLLVTAEAVAAMAAGSVLVDMGSSDLGGNVAGSRPGETVVTANGVSVVGAGNLASDLATSASQAYARNISALLAHLSDDAGGLHIDLEDEITRGVVVAHQGAVTNGALAELLGATT
jgi:NAD(P) transhydrogenase subunit alpha